MKTTMRQSAPFLMLALVTTATACGKEPEAAPDATVTTQMIGPDNMAVAKLDTLSSGPAISGALTADREARIRAEVSGSVLQTMVEAGQRVSAGTVLARIDDAAVSDAAISAKSGLTQAQVAADQASRELQRSQALAKAGAISERDVEAAERANLSAQAGLADAKARVSMADKNLRNTIVRAPFAGVVAERAVSPGDVVSPGAAMFTVIDPRSLRVEASVPASALADIKVGSSVRFSVNGADRQLNGKISRVSPMVDPTTKQVRILATIPNNTESLVAGLFVEGRVAAQKRVGVLVPEQAVDQTGVAPYVMRVKNGKVEKVEVQVGLRDVAAEQLEITSGLAGGDTVLLGAARGISAGASVAVSSPRDASPRDSSPAASSGTPNKVKN
ncbi:MAG: efflux RND transporter periplasmic adaptor subunit [Gemmatimonadaceae bacterium]|nr:efflux RND transporter periplasmic adaptor subunit [Gemmatimonadaceae bacterium]